MWLARSVRDPRGRVHRSVIDVALAADAAWELHTYDSDGAVVDPGPRPAPAPGAADAGAALAALWGALDPRWRVLGVAGDLDGPDPSVALHQVAAAT